MCCSFFTSLVMVTALTTRGAHTADSVVHETLTIAVARCWARPRTINVYTPPGYASGAGALPVLYMLDGGMAEDFPHVAATIDSLIRLTADPAGAGRRDREYRAAP